eukprot:TRINITY_DN1395_c0_g1_i11.p1 TRINITY_DN1395_c0_g1~~TRINITY_DN1395_c0_g1_i11.p1  ORF type:complete len:183 (+),score=7.26 TRINITY_DN1395_c0_g1_i11:672-1220(+)
MFQSWLKLQLCRIKWVIINQLMGVPQDIFNSSFFSGCYSSIVGMQIICYFGLYQNLYWVLFSFSCQVQLVKTSCVYLLFCSRKKIGSFSAVEMSVVAAPQTWSKYIYETRLQWAFGIWATSLGGALAYEFTQPSSSAIKFMHARMYAQAISMGVILGFAAFEIYLDQTGQIDLKKRREPTDY